MDLAQIRKKAKQAKQEGAAQQPTQPAAADERPSLQEPVAAVTDAFVEPEPVVPEEVTEEPFDLPEADEPPQDFAWDEGEDFPADVQPAVSAAPVYDEPVHDLPADDAPVYDSISAVESADSPAMDSPAGAAEFFDPVAMIVSGRESAREGDDAVYATQADEKDGIREFLCFRVAREEYAIDIMEIKEIIKPRDVTEVPRSPQFISGIISLRGLILPVFDIALRLGFSKEYCTGKERVVVVRRGEGYCGIMVDEVRQVVRLAENALEPPPPVLDGIDRDFVTGIGRHGERMLILLNMEKVLDINVR